MSSLIPALLSFTFGITIVVVAAQVFLSLAQASAARWQLSPLFISLVVVAIGTTLPEFTVTVAAIASQDPGLALGNLVGSAITNVTLVFGVATLMNSVRIGTTKTPKIALLFLGTCLLFAGLQRSGLALNTKAFIWGAAVVSIFVFEYALALHGRLYEDKKLLTMLKRLAQRGHRYPTWVVILGLLGSAAGLGIGGYLTVHAISELAVLLAISTTALGLTLTAISTSLPEIITSVLAGRKEAKLVTGTLIGSSTLTLTLYPMILAASQTTTLLPLTELGFLLIAAASFTIAILRYKGTTIPWYLSIVLLGIYTAFVVSSIF